MLGPYGFADRHFLCLHRTALVIPQKVYSVNDHDLFRFRKEYRKYCPLHGIAGQYYLTKDNARETLLSLTMTTTSSDLLTALKGIGLNKNEASIYLTCLELGPSSIWDISKKSGIKRPTCYIILDELIWKGHASSTNDGKRTIYSVDAPKILLKAYNESLNLPKGSEILVYGTAEVKVSYGEFIAEYLKNRVKKGIHVRAILPDTESSREILQLDKAELRETRFLPQEKFDPHTEINVFSDIITYIAHSEQSPFGTVIESPSLANLEKQRFNLLWDIAQQ